MLSAQLKEILTKTALASHQAGHDLILKEKNVMTVKVTQVPSDVTAVKMEVVGHLPGVKGGELKRICDYLLVGKSGGKDHAVFVELKKNLGGNKNGMDQLRRSLPILEYLRSICQIHHGSIRNRHALKVRYFLIAAKNNPRLDKQPVKPKQSVEKEFYRGIEVHTFLGERIRFGLLLNE